MKDEKRVNCDTGVIKQKIKKKDHAIVRKDRLREFKE